VSALAQLWEQHGGLIALCLSIAIASLAILHILLFKSNSLAALLWIGLVALFPFAGAALYWVFGINRVWNRRQRADGPRITEQSFTAQQLPANIDQLPPVHQVGGRITGESLCASNQLALLVNGEEAFPAMLRAISNAKSEILLASFIFDRDQVGRSFVDALTAAQDRGVRVCLLLDDAGRRYSLPSVVRLLREKGLEHRLFMPLRLLPPSLSINLRNHRKILLVDQSLGFLGGMNIGDRQLVSGESRLKASDLHFCVEGPVLHDLRRLFLTDWDLSGGAELPDPEATPAPLGIDNSATNKEILQANSLCRLVADGPDHQLHHLSLLIAGVVSAAERRIVLITPYFLPDRKLMGALQAAALRGVAVTVVIPHVCNWPVVRWALNHSLWELLGTGIRVVEQPEPFAHAKCLLIDDSYVLVGSANIDARSLRLNFELGLEVCGDSFAASVADYVDDVISRSVEITTDQVSGRGLLARIRDALAGLLAPYL